MNIVNPKHTYIGKSVSFDSLRPENITIEDGVVITAGTVLLTHYIHEDGGYSTGNVVIKRNSFIGINSVICKDITIGENCIVGAGSIITKDIPDNEMWAGNPARFIKKINKIKTL